MPIHSSLPSLRGPSLHAVWKVNRKCIHDPSMHPSLRHRTAEQILAAFSPPQVVTGSMSLCLSSSLPCPVCLRIYKAQTSGPPLASFPSRCPVLLHLLQLVRSCALDCSALRILPHDITCFICTQRYRLQIGELKVKRGQIGIHCPVLTDKEGKDATARMRQGQATNGPFLSDMFGSLATKPHL